MGQYLVADRHNRWRRSRDLQLIEPEVDIFQIVMLGDDLEAIDRLPVEYSPRLEPLILPGPVLDKIAQGQLNVVPLTIPGYPFFVHRDTYPPGMVIGVIGIGIDQPDIE